MFSRLTECPNSDCRISHAREQVVVVGNHAQDVGSWRQQTEYFIYSSFAVVYSPYLTALIEIQ